MRAMDKSFEYRIYPSADQEALLQKTFGCCRWVYNRVLAMRRDEYARTGKSKHINSYITQIPTEENGRAVALRGGLHGAAAVPARPRQGI